MWRRYLLTQHPEVQRKLEQELDRAGLLVTAERPQPRALEYADLANLQYLSWISKVSYASAPSLSSFSVLDALEKNMVCWLTVLIG